MTTTVGGSAPAGVSAAVRLLAPDVLRVVIVARLTTVEEPLFGPGPRVLVRLRDYVADPSLIRLLGLSRTAELPMLGATLPLPRLLRGLMLRLLRGLMLRLLRGLMLRLVAGLVLLLPAGLVPLLPAGLVLLLPAGLVLLLPAGLVLLLPAGVLSLLALGLPVLLIAGAVLVTAGVLAAGRVATGLSSSLLVARLLGLPLVARLLVLSLIGGVVLVTARLLSLTPGLRTLLAAHGLLLAACGSLLTSVRGLSLAPSVLARLVLRWRGTPAVMLELVLPGHLT
ncbi:hypothetical protein [Halosimplex amylolyticum]|uniref:hypothetical protein n=1 Tax=Halosimplex amylolyticum TaxID=3396616 RepID=UPI003F54CC37